MRRVGILGDIGSGKTFVAKNFDYPVFSSKDYRNILIELSKKYRPYEF